MKLTVYQCDNCKKVLSEGVEEGINLDHVVIHGTIALAKQEKTTMAYDMFEIPPQKGRIYHFCGAPCLSNYITKFSLEEQYKDDLESNEYELNNAIPCDS